MGPPHKGKLPSVGSSLGQSPDGARQAGERGGRGMEGKVLKTEDIKKYMHEYYIKNKKKLKKQGQERYLKDRAARLKQMKEYYEENRDTIKAYQKIYRDEHKDI